MVARSTYYMLRLHARKNFFLIVILLLANISCVFAAKKKTKKISNFEQNYIQLENQEKKSLTLFVHSQDLAHDIDDGEPSIRVIYDASSLLHDSIRPYNLKLEIYKEGTEASEELLSVINQTVVSSKAAKRLRFNAVLPRLEESSDLIFKVYDAYGQFHSSFKALLTIDRDGELKNLSSDTPNLHCNANDGKCLIEYLLSNVSFSANYDNKPITEAYQNVKGHYLVNIPVIRRKVQSVKINQGKPNDNPFASSGPSSNRDPYPYFGSNSIQQAQSFWDNLRDAITLEFTGTNKTFSFNRDGALQLSTDINEAYLNIAPGDSQRAQIVLEQGSLLDDPLLGAIEFDGGDFYVTTSDGRKPLGKTSAGPPGPPGARGPRGLPGMDGTGIDLSNGGRLNGSIQFVNFGVLEDAQFNGSFLYNVGAANGYVLTSDANGYASWQPASGGGGGSGNGDITSVGDCLSGACNDFTLTATNASTIPLAIRAASAQTANLQEWQNGGGQIMAFINPTGDATFQELSIYPNGSNAGINFRDSTAGAARASFHYQPSFDRVMLGLSKISADYSFIVANQDNTAQNFDHGEQNNPTLFMQSRSAPNTNNTLWGGIYHDTNGFIMASGNGGIAFETHNGSALTTDLTTKMILTEKGNLGIGTTIPDYLLTINGNAGITSGINITNLGTANYGLDMRNSDLSGSTDYYMLLGSGTYWRADGSLSLATGQSLRFQGSEALYGHTGLNLLRLGQNSAFDTIEFYSNGSIAQVIDIDGNVGIGFENPNAKLAINGALQIVDGTQANGYILTSDANGIASWQPASGGGGSSAGTAGAVQFSDGSSGFNANANLLFADEANHRIGISTTNPSSTLTVNGEVTIADSLTVTGGGGTVRIVSPSSGGHGAGIGFGTFSTAFGSRAIFGSATGNYSTAIAGTTGGTNAISIGVSSVANSTGQISIGQTAGATSGGYNGGNYAVLLGQGAQASANEFGITHYVDRQSFWYDFGGFQGEQRVADFYRSAPKTTSRTDYRGQLDIRVYEDQTPYTAISSTIVNGLTMTTVNGNLTYNDGTQANGYILTSDANGVASWQPASGGGGSSVGTAGAIQFSDGSSGFNANANTLFWNNANTSLGINTNSPNANLEVNGSLQVSYDASRYLTLSVNSSGDGTIDLNTAGRTTTITNNVSIANNLTIGNNLIASRYLDSSNRGVDINAGVVELQTAASQPIIMGSFNNDTVISPARNTTDNFGDVVISAGGSERARFRAEGDLGIGLTNPEAQLHVQIDDELGDLLKLEADDKDLITMSSAGSGVNHQFAKLKLNGSVDVGASRGIGGEILANSELSRYQIGDAILTFNTTVADSNSTLNNLYVWNENDSPHMVMDHEGELGIGVDVPARKLHISEAMRIEPSSSPPASPSLGDLYVDSDSNELCFYNGSSWVAIAGAGSCS